MAKASQKAAKKGADSIGSKLPLVMKSGKYTLGFKTTLKTLRAGKAKLVILANNLPALRMSEIEYYAMLSKTQVIHFGGEPRGCHRLGGGRGRRAQAAGGLARASAVRAASLHSFVASRAWMPARSCMPCPQTSRGGSPRPPPRREQQRPRHVVR